MILIDCFNCSVQLATVYCIRRSCGYSASGYISNSTVSSFINYRNHITIIIEDRHSISVCFITRYNFTTDTYCTISCFTCKIICFTSNIRRASRHYFICSCRCSECYTIFNFRSCVSPDSCHILFSNSFIRRTNNNRICCIVIYENISTNTNSTFGVYS